MTSLLIAAALLLQDKAAEETFKRIEESLEKAKTAGFKFKASGAGKEGEAEEKFEASGAFLFKKENRINATIRMVVKGQQADMSVISDGVKTRTQVGSREPVVTDAPKNVGEAALGWLGVFLSLRVDTSGEETDLKKMFKVSDIKAGEDEKEAKTLTYKVDKKGEVFDAKVWYDPKTLRILKRSIALKSGKKEGTLTETYEEYALDVDIPDEKFQWAAEK